MKYHLYNAKRNILNADCLKKCWVVLDNLIFNIDSLNTLVLVS